MSIKPLSIASVAMWAALAIAMGVLLWGTRSHDGICAHVPPGQFADICR